MVVGFIPHATSMFEGEPCAVALLLNLFTSPDPQASFAPVAGLRAS